MPACSGSPYTLTAQLDFVQDREVVLEATCDTFACVVIDGNSNSRIAYVGYDADVVFRNLKLTNGDDSAGGGILSEQGLVTLDSCEVSNCDSSGSGGGICSHGGTLVMRNSTVVGNTASSSGGGIFAEWKGFKVDGVNNRFQPQLTYLYSARPTSYAPVPSPPYVHKY